MARLFISYSRKDEPFARRLATSLAHSGANVWLDVAPGSIPAGANWSAKIQEGLDVAQLMVLIISPDSMASNNVANEWQYFIDQRKPIIPILLRPAKIHFQLNRLQYIDFHKQDYDAALMRLYDELRRNGIAISAPPTTTSKPAAQPVRPVSTAPVSQPAKPPATLSPRWILIGVAVILGILGLILVPRLNQPASTAGSPTITILRPGPGSTIGDEILCIDGTASPSASLLTVQVKDANESIIDLSTAVVNANNHWRANVTVPAHSPSDGSIVVYMSDRAGAITQQASIAVKLTDHYFPAQPSLGVIPDDLCQDSDSRSLSQ